MAPLRAVIPSQPVRRSAGRGAPSLLVCGVSPVSAHGITAAVHQHGMHGERLRDLGELQAYLVGASGTHVVLTPLGLASATSHMLQRCAVPDAVLTVLLDDPSPEHHVAALRAGARGVAHSGAPLAELIAVLSAAARGFTVLPAPVARALCLPMVSTRGPDVPIEERSWLRQLAQGVSVAELALRSSYSEREMYRLLNRAYQRLGAANRTEALLAAQRAGLLST